MIPYGRQSISEDDIAAVVEVLRSDFLTQGPAVPRFEQAVAARVGAAHAVAVNSATSALHLACLALGIGAGDRVWTVPNTFVASANCARYCGATVDFVDIDAVSWNLSVPALAAKLEAAERDGTLPRLVIPVHHSGQPCDMAEIADLARRYGFRVIEDASHAIGARYGDHAIGDCRFSDICVFSFHPVKIITSGEGGMATTNDPELAWRMATLRTHGITREAARLQRADPPPWHYEQLMLGYNYRMIDIEAALGLSQLRRLDPFVARRNDLARRYDRLLAGLPLRLPHVAPDRLSARHLYVVRLRHGNAASHRRVFERLRGRGIGVNLHYAPVHLQPDFRDLGFHAGMFPEAEAYGDSAITLPLYPDMTEMQQDEVAAALTGALATAPHRVALGTAQFGFAYGIANRTGQVPEGEARAILDLARRSGIDTIDTAIAYGDSEAVLGRIGDPYWRLVTKLPAVPEGVSDAAFWATAELEASRLRLKAFRFLLCA